VLGAAQSLQDVEGLDCRPCESDISDSVEDDNAKDGTASSVQRRQLVGDCLQDFGVGSGRVVEAGRVDEAEFPLGLVIPYRVAS